EDGIRDFHVTGVQTCALPILSPTPTMDPLDASALAFVEIYVQAAVAAKVNSDVTGESLEGLIEPTWLDIFTGNIAADLEQNRRYEGTIDIVWAEVAERELDGPIPQLLVDACLDASNFLPVDVDTRSEERRVGRVGRARRGHEPQKRRACRRTARSR